MNMGKKGKKKLGEVQKAETLESSINTKLKLTNTTKSKNISDVKQGLNANSLKEAENKPVMPGPGPVPVVTSSPSESSAKPKKKKKKKKKKAPTTKTEENVIEADDSGMESEPEYPTKSKVTYNSSIN